MKNAKKLKLSIFEIVWYSLCLLILLWGLTYIVLGLVAKYAPIPNADNAVKQASDAYAKTFKLGFFEYGLIHTGVAAVLAIIVLLVYSRGYDREYEKEQRRAALRQNARSKAKVDLDEEKEETFVVEATPVETPVEEEATVEEPKAEEEKAEEPKVEEEKAE